MRRDRSAAKDITGISQVHLFEYVNKNSAAFEGVAIGVWKKTLARPGQVSAGRVLYRRLCIRPAPRPDEFYDTNKRDANSSKHCAIACFAKSYDCSRFAEDPANSSIRTID